MARQAAEPQPAPAVTRGRPTAARIVAIDQAIRAAALEQFLAAGYDGASMDAVAAAARVSKGTLYARYKGKEALFRTILVEQFHCLNARAASQDHLLPAELGPRLRHHARILLHLFEWAEFRRIVQLVESAAVSIPQAANLWQRAATVRYIRFLARDMAAAARLGPGASVDWIFLANLFLHSIVSCYRAERARPTATKEEAYAFADKVCDAVVALARKD